MAYTTVPEKTIAEHHDIFLSPRESICGAITDCKLYTGDCTTPVTAESKVRIHQTDWGVIAKSSVSAGWTGKFCYKCFSAKQPLGKEFILSITQAPDCMDHIQLIAPKPADSRLAFKPSPSALQISSGVDALFTNAKPKPSPAGCGAISKCGLYASDCVTELSTEAQTWVSMESARPWTIT